MTPVLYYGGERNFTSNGIASLTEGSSCIVTEERNGIYEAEIEFPVTGAHYADIQIGRIICCSHDDTGDKQPFVIYRRSEPLNGVVTFNAHHVSYKLNHVIVKPFSAASVALTLQAIPSNCLNQCDFTFWTDRNTAGTFKITAPRSVRNLLGGEEGSLLDVYGAGEYEFDKYTVKFYQNRGADRGVTIRYGKNLVDYNRTVDDEGMYSAILPYWYDSETDTSVYGGIIIASAIPYADDVWTDENGIPIVDNNGNVFEFHYQNIVPVAYDFTGNFLEQPTVAQLNAAALAFLDNNQPYLPSETYSIDFVQLWQTEEYAAYAPLQAVKLCDTVTVVYPDYGVSVKTKVIKTVFNSLTGRYDQIELGKPYLNYAEILLESSRTEIDTTIRKSEGRTYNAMEDAIDTATTLLTGAIATAKSEAITTAGTNATNAINTAMSNAAGGSGSYIKFTRNANGGYQEMFIMNTEDSSTATRVWRYNSAGWGYSSTGINGPYTLAATMNGAIVGDFLTVGTIQGYSDDNYWDLTNGYLHAEYGQIADFTLDQYGLHYKLSDGVYNYSLAEIKWDSIYFGIERRPSTILIWGHRAGIYHEGFYIQAYDVDIDSDEIYTDSMVIEGYNYNGFQIKGANDNAIIGFTASDNTAYSWTNWEIRANFKVATGYTKDKVIETKDYSRRLVYCYETSAPMYGDIGEGKIGDDGQCYIWLDPVFSETIDTNHYQVFLQAYGNGDAYVAERKPAYFVVKGTIGLEFGWELKSRQGDLGSVRLANDTLEHTMPYKDFGKSAQRHIENIMKERGLN